MTPESIKSTLDLLDKHAPSDPIIARIGLTPDQVRKMLRTPPRRIDTPSLEKAHGMALETARKYLPLLRKYLCRLKDGEEPGHRLVRLLATGMGYDVAAAKNLMYSKFGTCAPTINDLAVFIGALEGRLRRRK